MSESETDETVKIMTRTAVIFDIANGSLSQEGTTGGEPGGWL